MVRNWNLRCSIAEIQELQELPVQKVVISPEVLTEFQALYFGEAAAPEIERMEKRICGPAAGKVCDECNGAE